MNNIKVLHFNRMDVSEGINVNKTSASKECIICCYFLKRRFKFQSDVCYGCHDVLTMPKNFIDITILNIHGIDYCCIINGLSKREAMKMK